MKRPSIRLAIVDDHELVRKGLRCFLDCVPDFSIVGEAETSAEAVALVESKRPDIVLLDVRLPDASGMETCRKLLAVAPHLRILILTSYAEDATVVAAIQSGAHGYVLKDVRTDDLVRAIRTVAQGRAHLDPRIAQQALRWIRTRLPAGAGTQGIPRLSRQERLIMPLLAEGKTNKEIASKLRLSDKTVKNYLANIFDKLQVRRRTEAVAWYVKQTQATGHGQDT